MYRGWNGGREEGVAEGGVGWGGVGVVINS